MDIGKLVQYIRLHKYIWKLYENIYSNKIQRVNKRYAFIVNILKILKIII